MSARFPIGQRVRHRIDGRIGVVTEAIESDGAALYTVAFPDGEWDLDEGLLEEVARTGRPTDGEPIEFKPYRVWLRREATRLVDAYRNDPTAALSNSRIEPKHHQVSVALRALAKSQPRLILADEVGLGKTIEAGLILKELRARGVLDRVLVITPANLITQWQHELSTKFNEHFSYANSDWLQFVGQRLGPNENPWASGENLICSLQYVRREDQRELLAAAPWDLVIVDEAHHARRTLDGPNQGYRLLAELRDRVGGLLLLTATPLQLHEFELYSMVELVAPGLFEDYSDFIEARHEIAAINEHVAWLRLPAGDHDRPSELYELLRERSVPVDILHLDPTRPAERARLVHWAETQHRLTEALVRNRKAEVGGFTQREARRIPVEPTAAEVDLEYAVHDYITRQYAANPAQGLVLVTFRKILASSTEALALAFERRANRLLDRALGELEDLTDEADVAEEIDAAIQVQTLGVEEEVAELENLTQQARSTPDSKLEGLDRALHQVFTAHPNEKVLIFTQFIGTLNMIRERLKDRFRVAVFHGGMSIADKDSAHRAFRGDAQIMISSEAGGEGRNFQFCHVLVNYDLPWNPMKVEQRIGRLDRVGQEHDVLIHNFELEGTLDQQILDVLENRIRVFTETVGALDPILGDVERQIEQIYLLDPEEGAREFTRFEHDLDTRLHQAHEKESQLRDFILDTRSFRRDEVRQLLRQEPTATPTDLERFVRVALDPYPTARISEQEDRVLAITLPPVLLQAAHRDHGRRLRDRYVGTFDHQTAVDQEYVDFFAFGHPMIEALIEHFGAELEISLPMLAAPGVDGPGAICDYRVRFTGVHSKEWILSNYAADAGVTDPPVIPPPPVGKVRLEGDEFDPGWVEQLRTESKRAANARIEDEFTAFQTENDRLTDEERARLEKLYDFQVRFFANRITQHELLITEWESFGTDQQRALIPARHGLIRVERERIARVEEERSDALMRLAERREPSREVSPIGTTIVMQRMPQSSA